MDVNELILGDNFLSEVKRADKKLFDKKVVTTMDLKVLKLSS